MSSCTLKQRLVGFCLKTTQKKIAVRQDNLLDQIWVLWKKAQYIKLVLIKYSFRDELQSTFFQCVYIALFLTDGDMYGILFPNSF